MLVNLMVRCVNKPQKSKEQSQHKRKHMPASYDDINAKLFVNRARAARLFQEDNVRHGEKGCIHTKTMHNEPCLQFEMSGTRLHLQW